MAGKKKTLEEVLKFLGKKKVDKMDKEATSSLFEDLVDIEEKAAKKAPAKKAASKAKSPKKGTDLEKVEKRYTPAQRKALEEELDRISRGSMEMNRGGMSKAKPAKKMMGGGMTKKYNVGGMAKANCGASMKPNGGSRNK